MSKSRGNVARPVERAPGPRRRRAAVELRVRELAVDAEAGVAREHRRDHQPLPAHALEHLLVLRHLREPRRLDARAPPAPVRPDHVLDRWIRSRLHGTVVEVDRRARGVRRAARPRSRSSALVDDLSNWYVRRSRSRFWNADDTDAHAVLHECLLLDHPAARAVLPVRLRRAVPGPRADRRSRCTSRDWPVVDDVGDRRRRSKPTWRSRARSCRSGSRRAPRSRLKVRQPLARALVLLPGRTHAPGVGAGRDRGRAQREAARDGHEPRGTARLLGRPELPPARPEGRQAHAAGEGAARRGRRRDGPATRSRPTAGSTSTSTAPTIRLEPDDVEVRATSHEELALAAGRRRRRRARHPRRPRPASSRASPARSSGRSTTTARPRASRSPTGSWPGSRADGDVAEAVVRHRDWIAGEVLARELHLEPEPPEPARTTSRSRSAAPTVGVRIERV